MTQPALFRDRSPVVEVDHSAPAVPIVVCPSCKATAPRVAIFVGLDLHHCSCGRLLERWHCCGAVAVSPKVYAYRARDFCENCGHDRRGVPVPVVPLNGGMSLEQYAANFVGVKTTEEE